MKYPNQTPTHDGLDGADLLLILFPFFSLTLDDFSSVGRGKFLDYIHPFF
jgi:hypothetical protein